jgi:hypothetical protein
MNVDLVYFDLQLYADVKDSRPHSYSPIAIRQQESMRTAGRTYTGPRR